MTARLIFEATAIELSKILAPLLKLYEFNYLFNKAINQYINKVYNVYDINQQTTDDLRVLKTTAFLTPKKVLLSSAAIKNTDEDATAGYTGSSPVNPGESVKHSGVAASSLSRKHTQIQSLHGATYEVDMPEDYLHMLNCVCIYYVAKTDMCWDEGSYIEVPALRLTADSWSQILTDIYNRPSPMRPYYYIHNLTTTTNTLYSVTSNYDDNGELATQGNSNFSRTFKIGDTDVSAIEKPIASRKGNPSTVRCEIRYGRDDSLYQLAEVLVDYVKVPQHIRLTQEQMDLTEDTSQIMEFPDYVNQEIINELVHLVMEKITDPRLGTHVLMSLTIARPTGQLQQQTAAQG